MRFSALAHRYEGLEPRHLLAASGFSAYELLDALVDLPFALPTAVAGIALTAIYAPNGWLGQCSPIHIGLKPGPIFSRSAVSRAIVSVTPSTEKKL